MKKIRQLFIQPVDVWLFRDGRPFDAGSAHRAESMFPPYPTVIQGAIRTHRLVLAGINLGDRSTENIKTIGELVGSPDTFGDLKIRGPFIARKRADGIIERLFPKPADAVISGKMLQAIGVKKDRITTLKTSHPLPLLLGPMPKEQSKKQGESLWLSQSALIDYLAGKIVEGIYAKDLFMHENRTGIGIGAGRVVEEGMLYEADFIRPQKDIGLLVEMQDCYEEEWTKPGVLHLGGEKRMSYFSPEKVDDLPSVPQNTGRFKIYFSTPTFFENGWQPVVWNKFFANPVNLVGAAINRYETMGGFNWIADPNGSSAHRAARRFVPAGSVYYFEGNAQLISGLLQEAITDFGAEIGFGQTIIKEW